MIETKNKTWYVARRGELLAEQFLLDLKPQSVSSLAIKGIGLDYMAFFQKTDGASVVIGVEVKATERDVKGRYILPSSVVHSLLNSNLPILFVVVDVKGSHVYFNWIKDALSEDEKKTLDQSGSCSIYLREDNSQEREKLRREIVLQ